MMRVKIRDCNVTHIIEVKEESWNDLLYPNTIRIVTGDDKKVEVKNLDYDNMNEIKNSLLEKGYADLSKSCTYWVD